MPARTYYRPRYRRYRPSPRYRRHGSHSGPGAAAAVVTGVVLALSVGHTVVSHAASHHPPAAHHHHEARVSNAAVEAIAYARHQIGKPYQWGGTGPGSYDCSGLVMEAYLSAGITIPRTAAEQWDALRHVTTPRPGDLVFFAGSDGTWTEPGHVALVTGRHWIIQAYETGTPVMRATFGLATSLGGIAAGDVIGYARP